MKVSTEVEITIPVPVKVTLKANMKEWLVDLADVEVEELTPMFDSAFAIALSSTSLISSAAFLFVNDKTFSASLTSNPLIKFRTNLIL